MAHALPPHGWPWVVDGALPTGSHVGVGGLGLSLGCSSAQAEQRGDCEGSRFCLCSTCAQLLAALKASASPRKRWLFLVAMLGGCGWA